MNEGIPERTVDVLFALISKMINEILFVRSSSDSPLDVGVFHSRTAIRSDASSKIGRGIEYGFSKVREMSRFSIFSISYRANLAPSPFPEKGSAPFCLRSG